MTTSILDLMQGHKGQACYIHANRPLSLKELCAGNKDRDIRKVSAHNVVWGIDRDNKAAVREARANGTAPEENQGLNGMTWIVHPFVKRADRSGKTYISVFPAKNGSRSRIMENGTELTTEQYHAATTPSSRKPRTRGGLAMFDIGVETIERIVIGGTEYRPTSEVGVFTD